MSKPLVAYYRVSTREQGRSGLSIDAQRAAVTRFAEAEGFEGARAGEGGLKQAKEQAMGKVQETQGNLPIWLQTQDTK